MTVIARTAYPRFKHRPTIKELTELYSPTPKEIEFVGSCTKSHSGLLRMMVMLKSFQRLGYFPTSDDIPIDVVDHIRSCLKVQETVCAIPTKRNRGIYQQKIRTHLGVKPYDLVAHNLMATALAEAAQSKEHPADLINIAIEELVKERYELPAFSTLDRSAGHARQFANTRLFRRVSRGLTPSERTYLDGLLVADSDDNHVTLALLKAPPQKATLTHMQQLQAKFDQLMSYGDAQRLLTKVPLTKVKSFADQAKAMDIAELRDVKRQKRRTLLLCLLFQAQIKTRDHLVEMFLKRMKTIRNKADRRLVELREQHLKQTEMLLQLLTSIVQLSNETPETAVLGEQVRALLDELGGPAHLLEQCESVKSYNSDNYRPLMWRFYARYRKILFNLVRSLDIHAASQDDTVIRALHFVLEHQEHRGKLLPMDIDLSFAGQAWRQLVIADDDGETMLVRQQLEICVFSYLAQDLKTGDAYVVGSESYADLRAQMLTWEECEPELDTYCEELGFPNTAAGFVELFKTKLTEAALSADQLCHSGEQVSINQEGRPSLKRLPAQPEPPGAEALKAEIIKRMPERSVLDILCNAQHWFNWTRHFGHVSGSEPKFDKPMERYILTTFAYGCNIGPNETARHTRGVITPHMLSYVHRRHIDTPKLEAAVRDIINAYNGLTLPKCWGDGTKVAADGSKFEVYENNLLSEYHIRYGGYGGIGYYHVSDKYIALFTHFIACGVFEAIFILDGLIKNTSDIQPDTLHADTHGQSEPVFGLAMLLGIELLPRIKDWKRCTFYRPSKSAKYDYLEPLFKGVIDWKLIETHWQDLMRMVLSIKAGKVLPSTLLRKLNSYSKKNRLHQALRELGRVGRTIFLLRFVSEPAVRRQITACTNIVETYHHFLDWLHFGKHGMITENDPDEQEKRLKYLDLVASAVIFHNAVDMSLALQQLGKEGYLIDREALATMSPFLVGQLKRFGDFVVDMETVPVPFEQAIELPIDLDEV
ncbi:MAG: Tn3 family transposase [Acaryochloris sp. CRU_2_0]|nr:Tn3 family transposase [Acaryochloris sp. CRU_2_0]